MSLEEERIILIKTRAGSYNYNLMMEDSDVDYKVYVAPTKDDLFKGVQYTKDIITKNADYSIHDIRRLYHLLVKSNVNFIEGLFSDDLKVLPNNNLPKAKAKVLKELLAEFVSLRDDIARINLPYLYNACIGMSVNKKKAVVKSIEKKNFDKARKDMMSAYRILDFLERFYDNNFKNFGSAIRYSDKERENILQIRYSGNLELYNDLIDYKMHKVKELEVTYKSYSVNRDLQNTIYNLLFQIVFCTVNN